MKWYQKLYLGKGLGKKKEKLMEKIEHGAGTPGIYILTLSANERDLLDIFSSDILLQPVMHGHCPMIVGLAGNQEEAIEMATFLVMETYDNTGGFDVCRFLAEQLDQGQEMAYEYPMERLKPKKRILFGNRRSR